MISQELHELELYVMTMHLIWLWGLKLDIFWIPNDLVKVQNILRYLNHHQSALNQVTVYSENTINRSDMLICVIFHLKYDRSTLEHEFYINFKPFPNKEILIKSHFNSCCFLFINSAAFNKFCRIGFLKVLSQVA
jgi:hypothetical protein